MKKLILSVCLLASFSCSKKNDLNPLNNGNNCETVANNYLKAIEEWSKDIENKSKCEAVKKSLNDILKSCSVYTVAQRKVYEEELKNFTCDQ